MPGVLERLGFTNPEQQRDFMSLSFADRARVLQAINQDFAILPDSAKLEVVARIGPRMAGPKIDIRQESVIPGLGSSAPARAAGGAVKGLASDVVNLADLARKVPSVGKYVPDAPELREFSEPSNTAERIGKGAEQVAEFMLPGAAITKVSKAAKLGTLGRIAAEGIGTGAIEKLHGGNFTTGAAVGAGTAGAGQLARVLAPKLAESALGVSRQMRGRGRTVGKAVLEETKGLRPGTVADSAEQALTRLTSEMESTVHQATQAGQLGSTQAAHQALDTAISSVPRNARELRDKLESLRSLLDLDNTPAGQPMRKVYSPDELLEIKRGIGKAIESWPPEWKSLSDVQRVKEQLYGAIDKELDSLVPGFGNLNQKISSLIKGKRAATAKSVAPSIPQDVVYRLMAKTGALAPAGIGYVAAPQGHKGEGAIAGLVAPTLLTRPATQMALARAIAQSAGVAPGLLSGAVLEATREEKKSQPSAREANRIIKDALRASRENSSASWEQPDADEVVSPAPRKRRRAAAE